MIAVAIPDGTTCELLEDHELLEVGTPAMHVANKFTKQGFNIHHSFLRTRPGRRIPAIVVRSKDDGRAVAFSMVQLVEAAQRVLQANKKGGIVR